MQHKYMTPQDRYCAQFHFIDVSSKGKCEMCGGTNLLPGMDPHEDPEESTEKEAIEAEQSSHVHP
jgi:hypothetical protein